LSQQLEHRKGGAGDDSRGTLVAWLVVALMVVVMVVNAMLMLRAVGDRPRAWSYRSAPLIPAQSYSSTEPASASTTAPEQIRLPPATVGKKAK
jgi:hypothetical protein